MYIEVTKEPDGRYRAQVGASEIRLSVDGRMYTTAALDFRTIAPSRDEALAALWEIYFNHMIKPHLRVL